LIVVWLTIDSISGRHVEHDKMWKKAHLQDVPPISEIRVAVARRSLRRFE